MSSRVESETLVLYTDRKCRRRPPARSHHKQTDVLVARGVPGGTVSKSADQQKKGQEDHAAEARHGEESYEHEQHRHHKALPAAAHEGVLVRLDVFILVIKRSGVHGPVVRVRACTRA